MKTRNEMQLKTFIKKRAMELNISPQLMLQNYYMECFVDRLAQSDYVDRFVLKGGYLISNLIGFGSRTTMDVDTTVMHFRVEENIISEALIRICSTPVDDDFVFKLDKLERIREDDDYQGLRAYLSIDYGVMHGLLTMDITVGDSIYPGVQQMLFKRNFEKSLMKAYSYPVETVLAEKLETIVTRGVFNTRPRDFYDIYMLTKSVDFDLPTLKRALLATAEHRKTKDVVTQEYAQRLNVIEHNELVQSQWAKYCKTFSYAKEITFEDVFAAVQKLLQHIFE